MTESTTTAHTPPRRMLRSIGAVVAGILVNIVLSGATDAAMHAAGIFPPMFQPMADHLWGLALAYRVVFAVAGGFLTARLAPSRPMRHVMVLAGIGTVLALLGVLFTWNKGPEFGPHWFSISVAIIALPCTVLGGVLGARRVARSIP